MSIGYDQYIHSAEWEARKLAYYAKYGKKCQGCGSTDDIQLHHHTYERMGHERDGDMLPVCKMCHDLIHRHHKLKRGSLTIATFEVIQLLQGRRGRRRGKQPKKQQQQQPSKPEFVPRNQRGAKRSGNQLQSVVDWREESRTLNHLRPREAPLPGQTSEAPAPSEPS